MRGHYYVSFSLSPSLTSVETIDSGRGVSEEMKNKAYLGSAGREHPRQIGKEEEDEIRSRAWKRKGYGTCLHKRASRARSRLHGLTRTVTEHHDQFPSITCPRRERIEECEATETNVPPSASRTRGTTPPPEFHLLLGLQHQWMP